MDKYDMIVRAGMRSVRHRHTLWLMASDTRTRLVCNCRTIRLTHTACILCARAATTVAIPSDILCKPPDPERLGNDAVDNFDKRFGLRAPVLDLRNTASTLLGHQWVETYRLRMICTRCRACCRNIFQVRILHTLGRCGPCPNRKEYSWEQTPDKFCYVCTVRRTRFCFHCVSSCVSIDPDQDNVHILRYLHYCSGGRDNQCSCNHP